ncbi:MAG: hypothetical protein ACTHL7_00140, partial [Steroidobacteraceae bacterium]
MDAGRPQHRAIIDFMGTGGVQICPELNALVERALAELGDAARAALAAAPPAIAASIRGVFAAS